VKIEREKNRQTQRERGLNKEWDKRETDKERERVN
jgi:hypothetical protein